MKTYNSSDLNSKRSEILEEAAKNGVVIQEKKTNGEVRREFAIISSDDSVEIIGVLADRRPHLSRTDDVIKRLYRK